MNAEVSRVFTFAFRLLPSALASKLAGSDPFIQEEIERLMGEGVKFSACKACADQLEVSGVLEEMGVEVKYWGRGLTELIRSGKHLLTV